MLFFIRFKDMAEEREEVDLNTSHVILYQCVYTRSDRRKKFKYISCYSLSNKLSDCSLPPKNLNTSHVILYLASPHFIGHHEAIFKYISCYSLSILQMVFLTSRIHLNTSHVILYHKRRYCMQRLLIFKYISCYSLSISSPNPGL